MSEPTPPSPPTEDLADLYENAPCGYVSLGSAGQIVKVNQTLAGWLDTSPDALLGRPFPDLLSIGGRIAFETHVLPMLRLQGRVDELAFDMLLADSSKVPIIANAAEKRDAAGQLIFTRLTLFRAVDRRSYERALVAAQARTAASLASEQETALLREQFIAVLGHDLRNPLAALTSGARMLGDREALSERGRIILKEMNASLARGTALVENLLDFARGQLGGGLSLDRNADQPLEPVLDQVVTEMRAIAPDREIVTDFAIHERVDCDRGRIAQMASNLLSNAVTHGAPGVPIEIDARTGDGRFVLSVANGGVPIPEAARAQLFQPFFRGAVRRSQQGLGLGLFIVHEIAQAHGGEMTVTSDEKETRFTLVMPL